MNWLLEAGEIEDSPLATLKPPIVRQDQVQPFTPAQVTALLDAAKRSNAPKRNEALILFMLDTGCRASEVCSVKLADVDLTNRKVRILGKGGKERCVYLGRQSSRLLWTYIRDTGHEPHEPLFLSERGPHATEALTRSGLFHIIQQLGRDAKLESVRTSPHTLRHTFAIEFLRAGGNVFSLKELLGHTSLHMTKKHVALAQVDLEGQHRQFCP